MQCGKEVLRGAVASQRAASYLPQIGEPASARQPRRRASQTNADLRRTCFSSRTHWRVAPNVLASSQAGEVARGLQRADHVHPLPLREDGFGCFASSNRADNERPDQDTLESLGVPEQTAAIMAGTSSSRSFFTTQTSSCASLADSKASGTDNFSRPCDWSDAAFSTWNVKKQSPHLFGKGSPWRTQSTPRTLQPKMSKGLSTQSLTSEVVILKGESQPWVLDRLRACFQHSFAEVLARLIDLERALTLPEGRMQ
eukprot:s298_g29.t1